MVKSEIFFFLVFYWKGLSLGTPHYPQPCREGKKIEILLPTRQVNFSFHLPPLKYYLPEGNTSD